MDAGTDVIGKPPGWGTRAAARVGGRALPPALRRPQRGWDFSGAVEDAQLLFLSGRKVADAPPSPVVAAGRRVRGRPPEGPRRARALARARPLARGPGPPPARRRPPARPSAARRSCACSSPASATPTSSWCGATTPSRAFPATSSWARGGGAGAPEWVGPPGRRRDQRRLRRCADLPRGPADPLRAADRPRDRGARRAFAEHLVLPVGNLHEVPEAVPDEVAVFTEPTAAALEMQEQVDVAPGDRVVVIGAGKLGQPRGPDAGPDRVRAPRGGTQPARARAPVRARHPDCDAEAHRAPAGRPRGRVHGQPRGPRAGPPRRAPARHDRPEEHLPRQAATRHGALRGGRDDPRGLALRAVRPGPGRCSPGRATWTPARWSRPATPWPRPCAAFDHAARPGALKILVDCTPEVSRRRTSGRCRRRR